MMLALLLLFGLNRLSERLMRSTPATGPVDVTPNSADPVTPGRSTELAFDPPSGEVWLEVEWHDPNGSAHWAKYLLPIDQRPPVARE